MNIGRSVGHGIKYRADIDGLRSIAVGIVVLYHAFPTRMSGGFIGVDVFFVISGFLITSLIMKEIGEGGFSILRFYKRRITRLFPALIAVMAASLAFAYVALFSIEFRAFGAHLAGGAAFVSNLVLIQEAGYFDDEAWLKPLQHLWSLGVEEQFYVVWPLFLMMVVGFGISKRRGAMLGLIAAIILASFVYNLYLVTHDTAQAYYSPLVRFWELMAGAFLAVSGSRLSGDGRRTWRADAAAVAGLLLIVAGATVFINETTPFPGWFALFPVVGACLIILAGPDARLNKWILANPLMVFVGLISYPLYLWHWPLLSFLRIVEGQEPSALLRVLAVALAFVLATATYLWIERPVQKLRNNPATSVILLCTVLAFGAAGYGINAAKGLPDRPSIAKDDPVLGQFMSATWPYSINENCESRYPVKGSDRYLWWFCMQSQDTPATFMLVGTSHANHLYPGLVDNPAFSDLVFLNVGTCDPAWVEEDFLRRKLVANLPCAGPRHRQQQELIDRIAASGTVKYAIFAGIDPEGEQLGVDDYADRLLTRIHYFEDQGIRVIVFAPQLKWESGVKRCFPRPFRRRVEPGACDLPADAREEARARFSPFAEELRRRDPSVLIFDPNDVFCENGTCSILRDGMPLYRDKYEHFSAFGSMLVGQMFADWTKTNVPEMLEPQAE